jgi:hypothetical protein
METQKKDFTTKLKDLDQLVSELTCDQPKTEVLKEQMSRLGIEYCEDPGEQMSRVLFLIQKIQFDFSQDLPEFSSTNKRPRKDGIEI